MSQLQIGPFSPDPSQRAVYCMTGDEPLMFQPEKKLNRYQHQHVAQMQREILVYTMSLLGSSKEQDSFFLSDLFLPRKKLFSWHLAMYRRAGLKFAKNINFVPAPEIYPRALGFAEKKDLLIAICYSYEMLRFANVKPQLSMSRAANSKVEFIRRAQAAGYRTPASLVLKKGEINRRNIARFFDFPGQPLIIKTDGLGGGFNVRLVKDLAGISAFTKEFAAADSFILQERVTRPGLRELVADFIVADHSLTLADIRGKLTSENQWFGNLYDPSISLCGDQITDLLRCVNALRSAGYSSPSGLMCCVDMFQGRGDHYLTEVNARWTGGHPVVRLLSALGFHNRHRAVAHVDFLPEKYIPAYQKLVEKYLADPQEDPRRWHDSFRIFPVSFAPAGHDGNLCVWFFVVGDYTEFINAKKRYLTAECFPLSDIAKKLVLAWRRG